MHIFYFGVSNDTHPGISKFLPISQSKIQVYSGYLFLINYAKVDFPEFLTPNIIAEFLFYKIDWGNS
jgi:glutaredoxin 2